ncbi:MBL fold metallo-hydrolase [Halorientalis regularis]|uniref:Putative mRNA 3-end processing factor n=1 Tax=Halorientalis regularis TaxID=660518 RepID=A0A1G7SZ64_9EURY|nr:mRNA 3'-end processing factor [Halorientalis regularis]SDG28162.1 putative mRNA 3-end processing factor [Halorientalis regularis]
MTVRYRDGIELTLSDGTRVVCDADDLDGDVNVVTHAHGDHYPEGEATAVCSELTAALATARRDVPLHRTTDPRVTLLSAGHVAGSQAALVTDPDGTRYLYTGDICTRSRFYLDGFQPPSADVLVIEATYGEPEYTFPSHDDIADDIHTWLRETPEPVILLGYALGRAQKLQLLAAEADRERVFTTPAVERVNEVIETHRDVTFDVDHYGEDTSLREGDALVLPMTSGRIDWVDRLATEAGAVKAGFSGWAVDQSFKFQGDYDVTFPLSDHCDFAELLDVADTVGPETVYTQHGSAATLADHLTSAGYDATSLRQNQLSLGDF